MWVFINEATILCMFLAREIIVMVRENWGTGQINIAGNPVYGAI